MPDPSDVVDIPANINQGLSSPKRSTMISILGMPRDNIDSTIRPVTNEPLKSLIVTDNVGPFRVTGLGAAVASLSGVFSEVRQNEREVYDSLGTAGMLAVRTIGGGTTPSNHSWGCAIDIKIGTALDGINSGGGTGANDGKTLAGLAAIAPYFNQAGWFWGAGFSTWEDGMHFEVAEETIRQWHNDGTLGDTVSARSTPATNLSIGDRGSEVRDLQQALADLGYDILPDGIFGPVTHGILIDFQALNGLVPDGIAGPNTKEALNLT